MTDLVEFLEFLRARLDEDKQRVEAAGEGRIAWLTYLDDQGQMHYTTVASGSDIAVGPDSVWVANGKDLPAPARVLVVYDSARARREVEAKREFLDFAVRTRDLAEQQPTEGQARELRVKWAAYLTALKFDALRYADHPDYREEWRP